MKNRIEIGLNLIKFAAMQSMLTFNVALNAYRLHWILKQMAENERGQNG